MLAPAQSREPMTPQACPLGQLPSPVIALFWQQRRKFSIGSWCLHAARQISVTAKSRGFNAMKNTSIGLELTEEEILFFRMPDEALEIVAGAAKQMTNFSIGYCSALSVCDG
jgi:hypothetical protein